MLELLQGIVQPEREPWWQHSIEIFLTGTVPVIVWLMENRRRARKQMQEQQAKIREDLERKHKENTQRMDQQDEKLDEILGERKYIPAHGHRESVGPLTAENIYYPPKR